MGDPLNDLDLAALRRRRSMKWRAHPPDVLPLWVAEMDATPVPSVVRAVREAVETGDTGYPVAGPYLEAFARFAGRRWDWTPSAGRMRLVPDVMIGVTEVLGLVTDPGDAVIVTPPVYPPFFAFIAHAGRRVVEAPLGDDLRLDLDRLDGAMAAATEGGARAALLLCNPHNPTGTVHTRKELAAVAALADRHGVRVLADEIHAPLVMPGATFTPFLDVDGTDGAFALTSASKAFNLAGLKAGIVVAGDAAADDLARLPEIVGHGASHVAVLAHTAALDEGEPWLGALLDALATNQRVLSDLLARHLPAARYRPGEGTYLAWLDLRRLGLGDDPAGVLLERARVALNHGPDFGTGGAGHARLNLATSTVVIEEAIERIAAATR